MNENFLVWGFLGFVVGLSGIVVLYTTHRKKQERLFSLIEKAEKDLIEDLEKIKITYKETEENIPLELTKDKPGKKSIVLPLIPNKLLKPRRFDFISPFAISNIPVQAGTSGTLWDYEYAQLAENDKVLIDQLIIENVPHRIFSLSDNHIIRLSTPETFIIKVTGNSMNAAHPFPIEEGDYVVMLHRPEMDPRNGDIVVVRYGDAGTSTAIKRLLLSKRELISESNDPSYQTMELFHMDSVRIVGVVIAVLKPI